MIISLCQEREVIIVFLAESPKRGLHSALYGYHSHTNKAAMQRHLTALFTILKSHESGESIQLLWVSLALAALVCIKHKEGNHEILIIQVLQSQP